MNYIDEIIKNVLKDKEKQDVSGFLKFLKEELDRKGVKVTINRSNAFDLDDISNIIGVELDTSEHDKKKDFEIAKYKNAFESAKCERDEAICKYKKEIEQLENWNQELQEALIEIPNEPIKVADFLIDKFADLERRDIANSKPEYIENVSIQSGEKGMKICKLGECRLRQIAKHLLIYCGDVEEYQ